MVYTGIYLTYCVTLWVLFGSDLKPKEGDDGVVKYKGKRSRYFYLTFYLEGFILFTILQTQCKNRYDNYSHSKRSLDITTAKL